MHVISGRFKGVALTTPKTGTRPTTDRTKEAIFSHLDSWQVLDDARVLDLFAGTGALGIEALSRGARELVAVESSAPAAALIAKTLTALQRNRSWERGMTARVIRARAEKYVASGAARSASNADAAGGSAKSAAFTFAPKITAGKAGSGLHIHMRIMKDGQNQMLKDGALSETARKAIAGMMKLASSITAFGNTNPTSYFRLVPHQEAPTNICWGDRNRSVLVRVPLGWSAKTDMCMLANPLETPSHYDTTQKQTVEMRSPDGSADLYQLIAGLAVACRYGFEIDDALGIAEKTYVNVNIHKKENEDKLKQLEQLPDSCAASADCLERQRAVFEQYHVFSPAMVDGVISKLRSYEDRTLRAEIQDSPEEMLKLVEKYFHCG